MLHVRILVRFANLRLNLMSRNLFLNSALGLQDSSYRSEVRTPYAAINFPAFNSFVNCFFHSDELSISMRPTPCKSDGIFTPRLTRGHTFSFPNLPLDNPYSNMTFSRARRSTLLPSLEGTVSSGVSSTGSVESGRC